eukprot:403375701
MADIAHQEKGKILIEEIRKTKKNEPKVFPFLLMVDKEAFGKLDDQTYILKSFWKSAANKIILARKSDTQSIVGYACYLEMDGGCYLMRIGVRSKCQGQGIGRLLMKYLFNKYPNYLSLDVSTDNIKAVQFYSRIGLQIADTYITDDKVEFNKFDTAENFEYIESTFKTQIEESKIEQTFKIINNNPLTSNILSDDDETQVSETSSNNSSSVDIINKQIAMNNNQHQSLSTQTSDVNYENIINLLNNPIDIQTFENQDIILESLNQDLITISDTKIQIEQKPQSSFTNGKKQKAKGKNNRKLF